MIGTLKSLNYKPSPIPSGGLEVPLFLKFKCDKKWVLDTMEEFVDNFYSFKYSGNVVDEDADDDEDGIDFEVVGLEPEPEEERSKEKEEESK